MPPDVTVEDSCMLELVDPDARLKELGFQAYRLDQTGREHKTVTTSASGLWADETTWMNPVSFT